MLMEDFNNICSLQEKSGGTQSTSNAMIEFDTFINDSEVFSLDVQGIPLFKLSNRGLPLLIPVPKVY